MRNLFISGGAGFLGRALLRVLEKEQPDVRCTIFSRDHGKHSRCQKEFPQHNYVIGDIRDYNSVELAMAGHDTVVHAAAFKYVPQGEVHVAECMEINYKGSENIARAAVRHGVERVVGISTDKACQPINVYGMSKLAMERLFQEFDTKTDTQFNLVRYGNVVSSTGSAIPLFRKQAHEGVITLTDPEMTRFWLSVYDGVELIKLALQEENGGTILIPLLPSLNMLDVAKAACLMEGIDQNGMEFRTVGIRFGEKKHEDLMSSIEARYGDYARFDANMDCPLFRLYPMTTKPLYNNGVNYSSAAPMDKLSIEDAIKMIEEAPE